jgi:hypothetical protein
MAPLADLLEDLPAIARTQGRRVENTRGDGLRRRIDEGYARQRKTKNAPGSQPARNSRI